jgi:serine/threonine protein kinase/tetratricopeptide (TPR) repeat protein
MNAGIKNEQAIFVAAVGKVPPEQWEAYAREACAGDDQLLARVRRLLRAHAEAGSFMEAPAPIEDATPDEQPLREGPGTVIGPYKLLEQIGEGGFGVVFMAEQQEPLRRKVALKVVKPGMDTRQVVARFEAERQALALMDHPNIARVFDGGETASGRPYFVMELVRGFPITAFCDQNQLTPRRRLELFLSVCQAVQHAHQKGIIHRDLKPANILVTLHDGVPVVKVIDFGIAKALGQQLTDKTLFTNFAQLIGTPLYMSPEQAEMSGLDVDTRSDVYSLGVLLYELLTGTTPFDRERLRTAGYDEIRRIIREEEPPRPSKRLSTLTKTLTAVSAQRATDPKRLRQMFRGELDWIVMRALEKDRNRRYESASAFAADVRRHLDDEPVLACPPSAGYRLRKFVRRNKAVLGVSGLTIFFLVLIGGGAGAALRDRAAREADLARDQAARRAKLDLEIEHALDDAAKARGLALRLIDNPYAWEAALAEAGSELKRARGLAAQDETALDPALRERLQALKAVLDADEADRRFAARFEEIRLEQSGVHMARSVFKEEIAFNAFRQAFQRHYRIAFGVMPVEQAATILRQRPKAMQDLLLAALDISTDTAPTDDPQMRQWLTALLGAADNGPWRRRAHQALQAGDEKAFEQVIEGAATTRQPPSLLVGLARKLPVGNPVRLKVSRRIAEAYPGDFWANHELACILYYAHFRPEEAIRYYTAAVALRPHNPAALANLGNALWSRGDLDGAIRAFRASLDGHPDYAGAHERLALALGKKGDLDGAIAEAREAIRLRDYAGDGFVLADLLARKGLPDEAVAAYQRVIARQRAAVERNPGDGHAHNGLAWLLATCAAPSARKPAEAVKLARKAVELAANNGSFWNTLGVAHYRAGNWQEAVAALERAMQLRNGGDGLDWFFLAMAHWRLGEKDKARQWFERAVRGMDKQFPKAKEELGRFRAEAADLLGVKATND